MVEAVTTYTATATRGTRSWTVQCDQVPAAISEVTRLDQAADHQREAIAFVLGVAESDVTVTVHASLEAELESEINSVRDLEAQLAQLEHDTRKRRVELITDLQRAGLSLRDVGSVLDISPQRVHQLARMQ